METNLGNNVGLWPQKIFEYVSAEYNYIIPYIQNISFKRIDIVNGAAIGGITIGNKSSGMMAIVPLIVSEFNLAPMDVMIMEEDLYIPMTEARVLEYLGQNFGSHIPKTNNNYSTGGRMPVTPLPPGHRNGDVNKYSSIFRHASEKAGFGPGVLKIIMDSMPHLIKKDESVAKRVMSVISDIPYRAVWIKRDSDKNTWTAICSDDAGRINLIDGKDAIIRTLSKFDPEVAEEMKVSDNIYFSKYGNKPIVFESISELPEVLSNTGRVAVFGKNKDLIVGQFYHRVSDMAGRSLGLSIWFNDSNWSVSEEMTGYMIREGHADRTPTVKNRRSYCFSFIHSDNDYMCTMPFKVVSEPKIEGGDSKEMIVDIVDSNGKDAVLYYSSDVFKPHCNKAGDKIRYYIPRDWKMHDVGECKISLSYVGGKSLADLASTAANTISLSLLDGVYYISGEHSKNLATSFDGDYDPRLGKSADTLNKAIWNLVMFGMSEGDARMCISSLHEHGGRITIGNIAPFVAYEPKIRGIPTELISLASSVSSESVDSILGLGMSDILSRDELSQHSLEIRKLESVLAKLLFNVRIGALNIEEDMIVKAMKYLSVVVDEIEASNSSIVREKKKEGL